MNTVNYNDAEQLFGAVGTSLKKHTSEIADIVNVYGAKNLFKHVAVSKTSTYTGLSFSVQEDGSIIANGTALIDASFILSRRYGSWGDEDVLKTCFLKNGKYIFNGVTDGSINSYYMQCAVTKSGSSSSLGICTDGDLEIEVDGDDSSADGAWINVHIGVKSGTVLNNVVFKPMIRLASIEDDTYVPYAKSNKELTDDISSLAARIKAIEDTNHLTWG